MFDHDHVTTIPGPRAFGAVLAAVALVAALAGPVQGQVTGEQPFSFNARGSVNVPTFDIARVWPFSAGVEITL